MTTNGKHIKVVLVQPSEHFGANAIIPQSIIDIAAILDDASVETEILDARLDNLGVYQIIDILKNKKCDLVGITGLNCAYKFIKDFCIEFKREFPDTPLIAGGHFIMSNPELILRRVPIDVACTGEGDEIIVDLVTRLVRKHALDGIPNIAYIRNGQFIKSENKRVVNLDVFPLPAYHLLDMNRYLSGPHATPFLVTTGRGCVNHCYYCSNPYLKVFRPSPEKILQHFELLSTKYGVRSFGFSEENAFYPQDWLINICTMIKKSNRDYDIVVGGCADHVSIEMIEALKSLKGNTSAMVAVEHWNPEIQKKFYRQHLSAKVEKAWNIFKENNMPNNGFNILWGHPDDNPESFKASYLKSISMCKKYNIKHLSLATLVIYPNSHLMRDALKKGKIVDYEDYMYSQTGYSPYVNLTECDDDEYRKFIVGVRYVNELKRSFNILFSKQKSRLIARRKILKNIIKSGGALFIVKTLMLLPMSFRKPFRALLEVAFQAPLYDSSLNYYKKINCFEEILNLPQNTRLVASYPKSRQNLSRILNSVRESNINLVGFVENTNIEKKIFNYPVKSIKDIFSLNADVFVILTESDLSQKPSLRTLLPDDLKVIYISPEYAFKQRSGVLCAEVDFV